MALQLEHMHHVHFQQFVVIENLGIVPILR